MTAAKTEKEGETGRGGAYAKYWEEANTERGRFGTSVDDHALGTSSQQPAVMEATMAAGMRGLGKDGVHWGKHHHHHAPGSSEGQEATDAKLRRLYLRQKFPPKCRVMVPADCSKMQVAASVKRATGAGGYVRGKRVGNDAGETRRRAAGGKVCLTSGGHFLARRITDGVLNTAAAVAAAGIAVNANGEGTVGAVAPRTRRFTLNGQGWESHTLKAQRKTEEYMLGREDLAPDMRPEVVMEKEVSLAYDVDVSEAGLLGAGSYGTVRAAVHRSTGRQVISCVQYYCYRSLVLPDSTSTVWRIS